MPALDVTVEVCGMAGDGTIAAGALINEALSMGGFSVLGFDSYPAEIRGFGRCVTRSRIGSQDIVAMGTDTNVLISLNEAESRSRIPFLAPRAIVIFESNPPTYIRHDVSFVAELPPDKLLFGIPLSDLAAEAAGTQRGRNLTALGAFAAICGVNPSLFLAVIEKKFKTKGDKVLKSNIKSFEIGYSYALKEFSEKKEDAVKFPELPPDDRKVMLSGNQAIGMAALDAGVKLYFGYPITPATPIMEFLASTLPKHGGQVVQMEDEISSIGAVLGSFYAGVRAMTATSGPGFALMTELITHGVMAEIPAVVIDAQRGGPATGLPTKTEQSDLHAAVFGGPGDSARIVIAPTNVEECYHYTVKSFQLAEKYQTPVIVLTDFYLDNRVENLIMPVASETETANANVFPSESDKRDYKRYRITDSGISPRSVPGMEQFIFTATGLEHTEKGTPDYSPEGHMAMTQKRHRKIAAALADLPQPEVFFQENHLDVGVIGWGSTFGSVLEAVRTLRERGFTVGALKITSLWPLHEAPIRSFMASCNHILIPELNYEGQLANLIGHLHHRPLQRLNLVTGSPFPPSLIIEKIEELVRGDK